MQYFLIVLLIALTILFVKGIYRVMMRSKKSVELITKYQDDRENPKLIDEIFDFVQNDRVLSSVVKKYNADKNDFILLHEKLFEWGDFRKYNRYIPITSFLYTGSLEYLLSHKNDDARSLTKRMMNYFHI